MGVGMKTASTTAILPAKYDSFFYKFC